MSQRKIRVLVVDDSALMRLIIGEAINSSGDMTVIGVAADGNEAIVKFRELKPDVVTLDIQMPGKNGQQVLEEIMQIAPTPVIMVSSLTQRAADATLTALDTGAVDYLGKPERAADLNAVIRHELAKKIRASAWIDVGRLIEIRRSRPRAHSAGMPGMQPNCEACIAIGVSTGGPPALTFLFEALSPPMPPIVVVQHMPQQFTGAFARRLDGLSPLSVKEAATGDLLQPNHVFIAPGGQHLSLVERRGSVQIQIQDGEPVCGHKPSVDVMMKSAAAGFRERCLGVIMTGMGRDGVDGCLAIRERGGYVLGQDQASSDVYGMNKVAFTQGGVNEQFSLENAPAAITSSLSKLGRAAAALSTH